MRLTFVYAYTYLTPHYQKKKIFRRSNNDGTEHDDDYGEVQRGVVNHGSFLTLSPAEVHLPLLLKLTLRTMCRSSIDLK